MPMWARLCSEAQTAGWTIITTPVTMRIATGRRVWARVSRLAFCTSRGVATASMPMADGIAVFLMRACFSRPETTR